MSHWLIVAGSARPLAQACVDAGMSCDVIDPWGDTDTRALARRHARIEAGETGFGAALVAQVERMAADGGWDGIVAGSGFEARPALLDTLSAIAPVFGNDADTVARCKQPLTVHLLATASGWRTPEVRLDGKAGVGWLIKPLGGCGGLGVRQAAPDEVIPPAHYGQRFIAGQAASLLFLADGRQARIVGLSRQAPGSPAGAYVWCEATADLSCLDTPGDRLAMALDALVGKLGLIGLNGIDLVIDDEGDAILIEINPRPTATMMLYGDRVDRGLFAAHLDACRGRLPEVRPAGGPVRGLRVVYAPHAVNIGEAQDWPAWCSDRPEAGSHVPAGAPLCTVHAEAVDGEGASALLKQREHALLSTSGFASEAGQMMTTVFS